MVVYNDSVSTRVCCLLRSQTIEADESCSTLAWRQYDGVRDGDRVGGKLNGREE